MSKLEYTETGDGHYSSRRRRLSQARAEDTRTRILQCARDAFAARGFSAANVRDIAEAADTTHAMIRYHFGSKEELWREAVRDMFALIQRRVIDPVYQARDLPFEERLSLLIRLYTRYSAEHPEHARITISETLAGGDRLKWMVGEFVMSDQLLGKELVTGLIERGLIAPSPMPSLLYAIVGMVQLPFVLAREAQLAMGYDFMAADAVDQHAQTVIGLLLGQKVPPIQQ